MGTLLGGTTREILGGFLGRVLSVSKWVEAITYPRNDANTVIGFIQRNILSRFGALRIIISDEGSHFAI